MSSLCQNNDYQLISWHFIINFSIFLQRLLAAWNLIIFNNEKDAYTTYNTHVKAGKIVGNLLVYFHLLSYFSAAFCRGGLMSH